MGEVDALVAPVGLVAKKLSMQAPVVATCVTKLLKKSLQKPLEQCFS
jgi:hypothetical protein